MVRSLFPFLLQKYIKKLRFSTSVPLHRTIYHDTKARVPHTPMTTSYSSYMAPVYSGAYEAGLMTVGDLDTVESYCRYFNWLKPPFELERSSNYHLFKSGIESMWEDEANVNGGKWVLTMKNNPTLLGHCRRDLRRRLQS